MFNAMMAARPRGLREVVLKERHPARPKANEPFCTRSQIVSYVLEGVEVARAHRYLRPDGSLGASGAPDPKIFFDGSTLFVLKPD
jgi:hypothetical protein